MYIVTHIRASLSSSVVDEMEKEEEEVKEGFVLVAKKGCFGLSTACSSCFPVYLYLRFANVDFDLRFNLVHPDSELFFLKLLYTSSPGMTNAEKQVIFFTPQGESKGITQVDQVVLVALAVVLDPLQAILTVIALGIRGCTITKVLNVLNKSRFYLGDVGNGTAMKLVVNMIMGRLLLSEKVGLDPKILVASQGVISAPMFSMKGISMIKSKYPTTFPLKLQSKYPIAFPLKHQQKDLRLTLGLAESVSHVY
ncbi:hypothetical protein GIB67_026904 [Kingdonia uniflora]|uniref:Uncharacterized protein n=1 Tax=Kingdonia uniflora TaxID=39325 RepID=A0A7J7LJR0_9MAGN|nr:hypothetical protein GIB67_026904 [Kingdonia uniflora]